MQRHNADSYAERAASNLHDLTETEVRALIRSREFREAVIRAFRRLNGEDSQVDIQLDIEHDGRKNLTLSWYRPASGERVTKKIERV